MQRGGNASAFDRCLGTRMGCEAVFALMNAKSEDEPIVIGINGNQMCHLPLVESVNKCQLLFKALEEKNFPVVCELRGTIFQHLLRSCLKLNKFQPELENVSHVYIFN